MAIAAPKRRSAAQAAPAPSRTAPPEPKKRPRDRPRPGGQGRSAAAAPATAPKRKPAAPKRKAGTAAPARKPPARKTAPKRRGGARVIPIAAGTAGRAAVAVTQLPESGLIYRLTRGRAWIGLLGVLLVGIVALNVVTLSFAASSGKIDARNQELAKENSVLQTRASAVYGQSRLHHEASKAGLSAQAETEPKVRYVHTGDVTEATARLAAAAAGSTAAAGTEEAASGEESTGEAAAGEEASTGESGFTPEEEAIYNREYEELLASEGGEVGAEEPVYEESVAEVPAG